MDRRRPLDLRAPRFARIGGLAVVALAGFAATAFLLLPLAARTLVRAVEQVAAGCIWLATSISSGMSVWEMLAILWRSAAAGLAAPAVSAALWGLVLVGLLALYWLQRLLGSERIDSERKGEGE